MREKKFLKAVNTAKKGDIIIWNVSTDEVLRVKEDSGGKKTEATRKMTG